MGAENDASRGCRLAKSNSSTRWGRLRLFLYPLAPAWTADCCTGWVQWAQRRASMGISLRHSGHFLVLGCTGLSPSLHAGQQGVHGQHDGEVNRGGNNHKGDQGIDEIADQKLAAANRETDGREIGLLDHGGNQRE